MTSRLPAIVKNLLGVAIALLPLVACVAAGSIESSLWLDEVVYWYYEDDPALREVEQFRPGQSIARYVATYFYSDILRGFHALTEPLGLTLHRAPELYLRLFSILSLVAAVVLVYRSTYRESGSWAWSVTSALAVSASPLLLFYAFEGRLSAFAAMGMIVYLIVAAIALNHPERKSYWIAGAVFSIFLTHLHLWIVCLFAAFGIVALVRCLLVKSWRLFPVVVAFTVPGAITVAAEAAYIVLTGAKGNHPFPLYVPLPFPLIVRTTLAAMFAPGRTPPPMPISLLPYLPHLAIAVALVLIIVQRRRSTDAILPMASVLGLLISIILGATAGYLIVPRYQVPLFAAIFASLRLANTRNARIAVGVVVALQLLLIPKVVLDIGSKANGKEIAAVIESETPREGTAVVVQHPLRLTYPDPLHLFVLHFYLDELKPHATPIRFFELPTLKDVTGSRRLMPYLVGGKDLLRAYAQIPTDSWKAWLDSSPVQRIWFVAPAPAIRHEHAQAQAFRETLAASGFVLAPRQPYRFAGYPPTYAGLFVRANAPLRTDSNPKPGKSPDQPSRE